MKTSRLFMLLALLALFQIPEGKAYADIAVIAHPSREMTLTQAELEGIFLGKTKVFEDGSRIILAEQAESSPTRKSFIKNGLNKSPSEVKALWAKLIFTGCGRAPSVYTDDESLKRYVANEKQAIGYIDSAKVDSTVKVLLKIQEPPRP